MGGILEIGRSTYRRQNLLGDLFLSVILIPPILSQIIVSDELNILLRQPGTYLGPAEHRSFS